MSKIKFFILISLVLSAAGLPLSAGPAHAGDGGAAASSIYGFPVLTYYANSPAGGASGTAVRKFVDSLPGLGPSGANNLGQYIPIATPIANPLFPNDDYYELGVVEYTERMHSDLAKATKLRGYVDLNPATFVNGQPNPHYLGPVIIAMGSKNPASTFRKPVRVKFTNMLPPNSRINAPVDITNMGAGYGPLGQAGGLYSENRVSIHLHGGHNPWVSDGNQFQWFTPAGETTNYPTGASFHNVPDMPDPGLGATTLYYANDQSARLVWYHDHAQALTRFNPMLGMAAGYLITDTAEQALIGTGGALNSVGVGLPLIIQDKTFVPQNVATQDRLWNTAIWGQPGDFWFPHVYEPNQDPTCSFGLDCMNPVGRWDYGPWIWPPTTVLFPNVLPQPSIVPESFHDTMMVNGTVYPYFNVERKAYRFRFLNGASDRFLNLQLYYAATAGGTVCTGNAAPAASCTEVNMVPRDGASYPSFNDAGPITVTVPMDGALRGGGVPHPSTRGPKMVQIANEGGFLPAPVVLNDPPVPIGWDNNPKSMTVGNVAFTFDDVTGQPISGYTLYLGPAERGDVIIDFSQVPAGSTIMVYSDAPAALPAGDIRYDYYTGNPDLREFGGAPSTLPGYGPNTRTIMQFRVLNTPATPTQFNFTALNTALPATYAQSQDPVLVPRGTYAKIFDTSLAGRPLQSKAIAEEFEPRYGRMNALLGTEFWILNNQGQQTNGFTSVDPATEIFNENETQIWKVVHNGVDTHAIHFHLFDVQVINRTDWAGVVKPPDANELGWKETVKMNPLEDIFIAMRPRRPPLPGFGLPNSIRPLDPTMPLGTPSANNPNQTPGWPYPDPLVPVPFTNDLTNFGWEYVWHCHILGHEENDMMRPIVMNVAETLPVAPSNLQATMNAAAPWQATLNWRDNATNEYQFRIERAPTGGAFQTVGIAIAKTNTGGTGSFVDSNFTGPGATYTYRVIAVSAAGDSAPSNPAMVTVGATGPVAPTNLTATITWTATTKRVALTWTDNAADESSFVVERSTNGGAFTQIGTVGARTGTGGAVTYTNTGLTAGNTYTYQVKAVNGAGSSAYSNTATANLSAPSAPTGLTATAARAGLLDRVTLNWTDTSNNETGFTIQRNMGGLWATVTTTAANVIAYTQNSVMRGRTYQYRIRANNAFGSSAWVSVSVRTP